MDNTGIGGVRRAGAGVMARLVAVETLYVGVRLAVSAGNDAAVLEEGHAICFLILLVCSSVTAWGSLRGWDWLVVEQ